MFIKDPCKKCIVIACCTLHKELCEERKEYIKLRENIREITSRCLVFFSTIIISCTAGIGIFLLGLLIFKLMLNGE